MKIISWNVNGIRAVLKNGFIDFVNVEKPDILCLQEIKAQAEQVDKILEDYENHYWNPAGKKGYSGTAVFSKIKPLSVKYGDELLGDREGRVILLEFEDYFLVNVYVPNSQRDLVRLEYRKKWDESFLKMLKSFEKKKSVIVCGDFNVAHEEIDLARPKENYNKTAGYTQVEIDGFSNYLNNGFIDVFREFDKKQGRYSFWSYMFNARQRNIGWRIDYFLAGRDLLGRIEGCDILDGVKGSDHAPLSFIISN